MPKIWGNSNAGDLRWLGIAVIGAAVCAATAILSLRTLAILIAAAILLYFGIKAGKSRALGVGVLGAVVAAVLIAPAGMHVPFYTGLTVGMVWLLAFAFLSGRRLTAGRAFIALAAPLLVGIGGALLAPDTPWLQICVALLTLIAGFVSGSNLTEDDKKVIRVGLIVLGCLQAALLIYEAFVLKGWLFGDSKGWAHPLIKGSFRAAGTLGHPIAAGTVVLVAMTVLACTRWKNMPAKLLTMALLLMGIFACGSMSVYITAGVCLLLPYAARRTIPAHFVKFLVGVLGIAYVTTDQGTLSGLSAGLGHLNSGHRINTVLGIPNLVFDRPVWESMFGSGWGSAENSYLAGYFTNDNFFALDNELVTVLMATGVVGLAFFIVFLVQAAKRQSVHGWVAFVATVMMFFSFDVLNWAATAGLFVAVALGLGKSEATVPAAAEGSDSPDALNRDDALPALSTRPRSRVPR